MKRFLKALGILFILFLVGCYFFLVPKIPVVTGYAAKAACSCTYMADRSVEEIMQNDLAVSPLNLSKITLDKDQKTASATLYGLGKKTAVYREGLGCILIQGKDDYQVAYPSLNANSTKSNYDIPINIGDNSSLDTAIDSLFKPSIKTRAVLVMHKDSIIAERYADGTDEDTPLLGWSMTKSITNALIGIAQYQNKLTVRDTSLFADWEEDNRNKISIEHLLHMNSGLRWEEDYTRVSDATQMLFLSQDILKDAINNKDEFKPIEHWEYSSGTSNILMGILKSKLGDDYLAFPKRELFDKIGMSSAIIETDESGNFIGSSYGYATTRDWAKFGRLFLNDGVTPSGERILPEGWVDYSTTAVDKERCYYGAHWWLNKGKCNFKDCPDDLYFASGFQGQYVYIIPSEDLIIVRLGLTKNFEQNDFIKSVIESI